MLRVWQYFLARSVLFVARKALGIDILFSWPSGPRHPEMDEVMPPVIRSRNPEKQRLHQHQPPSQLSDYWLTHWLEIKEFSIETKTSLHDPLLPGALVQEFEFLIKAQLSWGLLHTASLCLEKCKVYLLFPIILFMFPNWPIYLTNLKVWKSSCNLPHTWLDIRPKPN